MNDEKPMGQVIQIYDARIRVLLCEMVRGTVEETLNAMLDAEADQLCHPGWQLRSDAADQRPARELGRGVPDRDVPGGDFGAPSGGHH